MHKILLTTLDNIVCGKQISFVAPCGSDEASCIAVNGVEYMICDAKDNNIAGTAGIWTSGAIVSVILNTDTNKAYIQNPATPVGQKTEANGEIFGDYKTNQANAEYATTFGSENKSTGIASLAGGLKKDRSGAPDEPADSDWRYNEAVGTASMAFGMGAIAFSRASKSWGYRSQTGYPPSEEYINARPELISGKIDISSPSATSVRDYDAPGILPGAVHVSDSRIDFDGQSSWVSYNIIPLSLSGILHLKFDVRASMDHWGKEDVKLTIHGDDGELGSTFLWMKMTDRDPVMVYDGKFDERIALPVGSKWIKIESCVPGRSLDNISAIVYPQENQGQAAIAIGADTAALGHQSLAGGYKSIARSYQDFAYGNEVIAEGQSSTAFGRKTLASGFAAFATGDNTVASGSSSHAEGTNTYANGFCSHVEGDSGTIFDPKVHGTDNTTIKTSWSDLGDNRFSLAFARASHVEGFRNLALGMYSHAEGRFTLTEGVESHAEGHKTQAIGHHSHAEGSETQALKDRAHAEGNGTEASGIDSHAEGNGTKATASRAHAEGYKSEASNTNTHAEGNETKATNQNAHAEGRKSIAEGYDSHAEGYGTVAHGDQSHAEGDSTYANGMGSHAEGMGTYAKMNGSHACGRYNAYKNGECDNALFVVGNGTSDANRSNAFMINLDGSIILGNGAFGDTFPANPMKNQLFFLKV